MDFVQKKVTGQWEMRGREGPPGPLPWIQLSVPESGVEGQLTYPFPVQVAGPWMALKHGENSQQGQMCLATLQRSRALCKVPWLPRISFWDWLAFSW